MKTPDQKGKGAFTRMCVSCGKKQHKANMMRIVNIDNTLTIVDSNSVCGRSVYICNESKCISTAAKSHRPEKMLKCSLNQFFYDNLLKDENECKI